MKCNEISNDAIIEETRSYLETARQKPLDPYGHSVEVLRELAESVSERLKGDNNFQGTNEDVTINTTDANGRLYKLQLTIIRPPVSDSGPGAILVYFHGGGWVWGSRKTHSSFCELLSQEANSVVVSVEYRLGPEHRFPCAYTDACNAVRWTMSNRSMLVGRSDCPVGVAGDSAGGNLSASVCHLVKGIAFQVLIYPSVCMDPSEFPSSQKYGEDHLLTAKLMQWFRERFMNDFATESLDTRASPLLNKDFTQCPPAIFIVAECDPLADQSQAYQEKLDSANVYTERHVFKGVVHGCVNKPGHFKETVKQTIELVRCFIQGQTN